MVWAGHRPTTAQADTTSETSSLREPRIANRQSWSPGKPLVTLLRYNLGARVIALGSPRRRGGSFGGREEQPDLVVLDRCCRNCRASRSAAALRAETAMSHRDADGARRKSTASADGYRRDDYLTKPSPDRIVARLRAVLRRIRQPAEDVVVIVDEWGAWHRAGTEVHLGPTEYRLLDHLIQHPGRVFSREQLLDAVWGSDVYVEARTVDVHVGRLRKALNIEGAPDPIRTVRSAGYSLDAATVGITAA